MSKTKGNSTAIKDFIYSDDFQEFVDYVDLKFREENIFDITGMSRQEIKHSRTLGWLLGGNDEFHRKIFKLFIKNVLNTTKRAIDDYQYEIDPNHLKSFKEYVYFKDPKFQVKNEDKDIDIALEDLGNKKFILIENKIDAGESPDQLNKYREDVTKRMDVANKKDETDKDEVSKYECFGIFLTKEGDEPKKDSTKGKENREFYLIGSYSDIGSALSTVLNQNEMYGWSPEQMMIGSHYLDLLKKRNIVEDKEAQERATKIWSTDSYKTTLDALIKQKKKEDNKRSSSNLDSTFELFKSRDQYNNALNILTRYRPDSQRELSNYLVDYIMKSTENIRYEKSNKRYINFYDTRWNQGEWQGSSDTHSNEEGPLRYVFVNLPDKLFLSISIGPGDDTIRKNIRDCFIENKSEQFSGSITSKALSKTYHQIYKFEILSSKDYAPENSNSDLEQENINLENFKSKIGTRMSEFFATTNGDFEKINTFLSSLDRNE